LPYPDIHSLRLKDKEIALSKASLFLRKGYKNSIFLLKANVKIFYVPPVIILATTCAPFQLSESLLNFLSKSLFCTSSAYHLHTFCIPSAFANAEGMQKNSRRIAEE
jgi:hypothetical protein